MSDTLARIENLSRRLTRLYPFLAVLAVVGITVRIYWNFAKATDLMLYDEALYLISGARFLHQGLLPSFQYSPLYGIWYAADLALFRSPVTAFYVQMYVVAFLTAIFMYWFLRLIEVPRSLSVLGTLLWIAQPAYNAKVWDLLDTRPYHFALLIFLIGAVVVRKLKADGGLPFALGGAGFFLLAMAVRGEYFASLVLFLCWVAFLARSRPVAPKGYSSYLWPAGLLAGSAALVIWMYLKAGAPPASAPADHSWLAFGQHFSRYYLGGTRSQGGLNSGEDWKLIVGGVFPRAHSVWTAAASNPRAFLRFELHNVIMIPPTITRYMMTRHYAVVRAAVLCLIFVWIAFFTSTSVSLRSRALLRSVSALGPYLLSGAATILLSVLLTAKPYYLLPFLLVLFVGALKWFSLVVEGEPAPQKSLIGLAAVIISLLFAVIPSLFETNKNASKPVYTEMTEIRAILENANASGVRTLQMGWGGYSAYLPYGVSVDVNTWDRRENEPFWDFVQREHVDAVLVDESMRTSFRYRDDPEFALFLSSPARFGWKAQPVGLRGDVFYLRERVFPIQLGCRR